MMILLGPPPAKGTVGMSGPHLGAQLLSLLTSPSQMARLNLTLSPPPPSLSSRLARSLRFSCRGRPGERPPLPSPPLPSPPSTQSFYGAAMTIASSPFRATGGGMRRPPSSHPPPSSPSRSERRSSTAPLRPPPPAPLPSRFVTAPRRREGDAGSSSSG